MAPVSHLPIAPETKPSDEMLVLYIFVFSMFKLHVPGICNTRPAAPVLELAKPLKLLYTNPFLIVIVAYVSIIATKPPILSYYVIFDWT